MITHAHSLRTAKSQENPIHLHGLIILHGKLTAAINNQVIRCTECGLGGFLKRAMQGTLEYMAPEQLLKTPASHASDVYALAITINELAAGEA